MIRMMKKDGYHAEYAAALTAAVSILGPDHSAVDQHDHLRARVSGDQSRRLADRRRRCRASSSRSRWRSSTTSISDAAQLPRRGRARSVSRDYLRNTWRALPALVLPVLILGGIASGAFTPTEASVVAVFYALAAGRWIYRSLEWRMLPGDPRRARR